MRRLLTPAIGCLTLGLAPFAPEPHIVGKVRWVLGGARGMSGVDWFDLCFHGLPWMWLVVATVQYARDQPAPGPRRRVVTIALAVTAAVACTLWAAFGN